MRSQHSHAHIPIESVIFIIPIYCIGYSATDIKNLELEANTLINGGPNFILKAQIEKLKIDGNQTPANLNQGKQQVGTLNEQNLQAVLNMQGGTMKVFSQVL